MEVESKVQSKLSNFNSWNAVLRLWSLITLVIDNKDSGTNVLKALRRRANELVNSRVLSLEKFEILT